MQLMTFNSLLMFDLVFVFFLFLVGVTCLVYYLPTGKHHHHHHHPSVTAVNCPHNRQFYYHSHQRHQHQYHPHSLEADTTETEATESESGANCPSEQGPLLNAHPCRCHLAANSSHSGRHSNCNEEIPVAIEASANQSLLEHHRHTKRPYCQQHRIQPARCLIDDPFSDEDVIYTGNTPRTSGCCALSAASSPTTEHFVVVNETERALPPPHCCYIKAKFDDVKECVGPIADV